MSDGVFAKLHAELTADTAVTPNLDALSSDFQVEREDSIVRITIVPASASTWRLVPSTGTAFSLNADADLTAGAIYTEDVTLDVGRTWNIQTDTGTADITVNMLRVQELSLVK